MLTNTKLSTQTIPIKIFHGSFDIGLISSELENPTYTFLASSDDALENIVFVFNWEAVRGASLFVGWHHGKINTFNEVGDDFSFEETVIDKERFDLNKKEAWKTDFTIGFNLDILVLVNLLQKGTNQ